MLERGYNQAEMLAGYISAETRVPLRTDILIRKQHTPMHRVSMDERARELTVEKAFDVVLKRAIAGSRIILVDDVFTSGATASACSKVLKKNGAKRVDVLTLARAGYER
jgi:ComF family protein